MRRRTFLCLAWLILPAAFISCSSSSRLAKLHDAKAEDVYSRVADNYRRLQTFSGSGKIIIETPELQYAGAVQVVARPPDSLIVKVEAAFGVDVGFFFADRARFASYAPLENTYYTGRTGDAPELLFFHIEVSFEEIMSEMIGAVVPPFDSSFAMQVDGDDLRFDGKRGEYHVTYWVDAEKFVVKRGVLIDAKNKIAGKQEFSRFRKKNGVWLPQLIRAESRPAGAQQRLTIFYERIDPGSKVTPGMFTFKVPANAKHVDLSVETSEDGDEQR
jgi:outer membrane lipoprotein-sorting protein